MKRKTEDAERGTLGKGGAMGRDVSVLNPYGQWPEHMKGLKQTTFNPIAELGPEAPSVHSDCNKLVDAIVEEEQVAGDDNRNHWSASGKQLVSGIIAALVKYGAPEDKIQEAVRALEAGTDQGTQDFLREKGVL